MAGRSTPPDEPLDASGLSFTIVAGRFHADITQRLVEGAFDCLTRHGATEADIEVIWVPGAFEIPLAAQWAAAAGTDAVVAIGCVIRGDTRHFELVADESTRGLMQAMLETGVPMANAILAVNDRAQADARAGGAEGNKGEEAAMGAIEMAWLAKGWRGQSRPAR